MANGSEIEIDEHGTVVMVNDTDIADEDIQKAIAEQYPELASVQWTKNPFAPKGRRRTVFEQNRYIAPDGIFDEFRLAAFAAKYDDTVSNAVDTTENLAFKRVEIQTAESDEENDIWSQIVDELNLSQRMREMWRDQFIYSQYYYCVLWHRKTFKLKGKSQAGNKRKKTYNNLLVPKAISLLDPLRVIPIGNFLFNQERLVYIADDDEYRGIMESLDERNRVSDPIVSQMFEGKYNPGPKKLQELQELVGDNSFTAKNLFFLNPDTCFRATATRPAYNQFADVRIASIFELLDLKHILRAMDREEMLSATNAIILVKKGSDQHPATGPELAAAAAQVTQAARVPVIVSDHTLTVEIVTRKVDKVLQPERYNGLDSRITARLYQILSTGNYASGTATDNSPNLFKIIASTMESRRDNIRDSLMDNIFDKVVEKNQGKLSEPPAMRFFPRRIALDFDNNIAMFMQDLKDRNVISAETLLAEMDILLDEEIAKIKREHEKFPELQAVVPYTGQTAGGVPAPGSPTGQDPKAAGRTQGGNRNGGGQNAASGSSTPNNVESSDRTRSARRNS